MCRESSKRYETSNSNSSFGNSMPCACTSDLISCYWCKNCQVLQNSDNFNAVNTDAMADSFTTESNVMKADGTSNEVTGWVTLKQNEQEESDDGITRQEYTLISVKETTSDEGWQGVDPRGRKQDIGVERNKAKVETQVHHILPPEEDEDANNSDCIVQHVVEGKDQETNESTPRK